MVALLRIRTNLEVCDVPRSIDFYQRTLGLDPVVTMGEPPTFAILGIDDASMAIAQAERPAVAAITACYVDVVDVDVAHERCRDAGVEFSAPVTTHPWGNARLRVPRSRRAPDRGRSATRDVSTLADFRRATGCALGAGERVG